VNRMPDDNQEHRPYSPATRKTITEHSNLKKRTIPKDVQGFQENPSEENLRREINT